MKLEHSGYAFNKYSQIQLEWATLVLKIVRFIL